MAGSALEEIYSKTKVSPRIRQAALLYASGSAPTKHAAARLAGVAKEHFVNMSNLNPATRRIISDVHSMIEDETVATSKVLQSLSRKALGRLATLMDSDSETIAFRAAQDLADRGPETMKTQRIQMDSLTLTGEDAKALASAMVESSKIQHDYRQVGIDGLVEVDLENPETTREPSLKLITGDEG